MLCAAAMVVAGACTNAEPAGGGAEATSDGPSRGRRRQHRGHRRHDQDRVAHHRPGGARRGGPGHRLRRHRPRSRRRSSTTGTPTAASTAGRSSSSSAASAPTSPTCCPTCRRVCLELTEDEEVFATVAFAGSATPSPAWPATTTRRWSCRRRCRARCSTPATTTSSWPTSLWEDTLRSAVRVVDEAGELDDFEKIGVFGPLEPGMREAIDDGLAPALEEAGTELAVDGTIPFAVPRRPRRGRRGGQPLQGRGRRRGVRRRQLLLQRRVHDRGGAAGLPPDLRHVRPVRGDRRPHPDVRTGRAARERHRGELEGQAARAGAHRGGPGLHRRPTRPTPAGRRRRRSAPPRSASSSSCVRQGLEGAGDDADPRRASSRRWRGSAAFTTSGGGEGSFGPDDHTMPDQVRLVRFDLDGCECWASEGDWVDVDG